MSDLQQTVQEATQSESETSTETQSANSDQDILGNSAVQETLGFETPPQALEGRALGVYNEHAERTPNMMVGLSEAQQYDMQFFLENWRQNRHRYEEVSAATNMPAELIAAIHWREGSGHFNTYLHQGDPLGKPAVNVPNDIPVFYEWEEAAIHALNMQYHKSRQEDLEITADTRNPNALASYAETYNGLGYYNRGMASPYVYAGTDQYTSGKYVADGSFNRNVVDRQLGVMPMLGAIGGIQTKQDMSPQAIGPEFIWRRVLNGQVILRAGSHGEEVEVLQTKLQALGYDVGTIDGDFGNGTKRVVMEFQASVSETPDGVVGPGTAQAIQETLENQSAGAETATSTSSEPALL